MNQIKCLLRNALPDPDFKYFSNLKAVYLFLKAKYPIKITGNLDLVAEMFPLLCLATLSFRSSVQPI